MSRLQVNGLRKRYGSRVVVKDVSLEVSSGEVVGLLGPNGAGKTTCFYMIVGLIAVDDGAIHLDGREISHFPMHRRARMGLSYLPQEASVFRKLTVEENIRAVLELQEASRRGDRVPSFRASPRPEHRASAAVDGAVAVRRRAPPRRDRARARDPAELHSSRRAVRRASTRSRCSTSRRSSAFSRNAVSAS